jgi:hypothetical protein
MTSVEGVAIIKGYETAGCCGDSFVVDYTFPQLGQPCNKPLDGGIKGHACSAGLHIDGS